MTSQCLLHTTTLRIQRRQSYPQFTIEHNRLCQNVQCSKCEKISVSAKQQNKRAKKHKKKKIISVKARKCSGKRQHFNKVLKDGHSRVGEGLGALRLEKGKGHSFLQDRASLAVSLLYSHNVQPVSCRLQSASWLHKLNREFLLQLGYFVSLNKQYVEIKAVCQKLTAVTYSFKRFLSITLEDGSSFFQVVGGRGAVSSAHRGCPSFLHHSGMMKANRALVSTLLSKRQFLTSDWNDVIFFEF